MTMIKRVFACILSLPLVLALLTGCPADRPADLARLPEELMSQIDREQDDYLDAMKENSIEELLALRSVTYGSFSKSGASEILALFKVKRAPHAAGLDRTVAAVYDAGTYKLKSQKTLAADEVFLQPLAADTDQKNHILYIGSTTYQGYTTYYIELFQVEEDGWVSKPVSPESFEEQYAYAFAGGVLQVFNLSYSGYTAVYDYQYTLYWDSAEGNFKRALP